MIQDLRTELIEGRAEIPRIGLVAASGWKHPPYIVLDGCGRALEPVGQYLRDLALGDKAADTCKSYGHDLLRWFRLLWMLEVPWDRASEAEVSVMVGWMRTAANPQRRRALSGSPPAGAANLKTGKPYLAAGYAPRSINHAVSVLSGFYDFHAHYGRVPVANPVPVSRERRSARTHRSPLEQVRAFRRGPP